MSDKDRAKQAGTKQAPKKRMNEALLFILIIVVILGGMLIYVNYKEREPSPISGITMTVYDLGMNAVDGLNSEVLIRDAKNKAEESTMSAEDPDYVALANLTNYSNSLYQLTEAERNKKVSDNEAVFLDTIGLSISAQQIEGNLIIMEWWAEEEPEILNLGLGDFDQLPAIIDIYESIWKAGADAAASGDINRMISYLDEESEAFSAQLEPYEEFIGNIMSFLSESMSSDTGTDNGGSEILTNMDDYNSLSEE